MSTCFAEGRDRAMIEGGTGRRLEPARRSAYTAAIVVLPAPRAGRRGQEAAT